jgi:uncharacterized protein (DUF433 family)
MQPLAIIDRGRGPELAGTRITVFDVIHYLQAGHTSFYIAAVLGLSTREVDFLIQYINEHKEEVMAENEKIEARIARGNPPEVLEKFKASHVKLEALREEIRRRKTQPGVNHERNSGGQ